MTLTRPCQDCGEKEAEFEIRKISDDPAKAGFRRAVCRGCLGGELADDTTSILKISKAADEKPA